jgi:DNA repair protein RadC
MTSYRKLAVRSDRGHVQEPTETYSTTLYVKTGGCFAQAPDSLVVESALMILAKRISKGSLLDSPRATREFLITRLADLQHEVFGVIWLSTRHRVISVVEVSRGTTDGASVYPKEIVKMALAANASACILFHSVTGHRMKLMCPATFCASGFRTH